MRLPWQHLGLMVVLLVSLVACGEAPLVLRSSGHAVGVPEDTTYSHYVQQSKEQILAALQHAPPASPDGFMGGYSNQQAADMRAPFEWQPDCDGTGRGKGFLLIHGLTDSPFLLSDIAKDLHANYPCATIRGLLLPGHGTIAGDSLHMTHQQWLAATRFGIDSLTQSEDISQVYLFGFSTGTSLIIKTLGRHPYPKIKGVVLLSAAVRANNTLIALTPVLRHLKKWSGEYQEVDAARYESFAMNAAAEFYLLTRDLDDATYRMQHPMLMVVSADDSTIDPAAAIQYFCEAPHPRNTLIWYQTPDSANKIGSMALPPVCRNNVIYDKKSEEPGATANWHRQFNGKSYLFANHAHTAISIKPDNPHYGINGKYRYCRGYDLDSEEYARCMAVEDVSGSPVVFGETNTKVQPGQLLRRGTFNPNYQRMLMQILFFIDDGDD